MRFLYLFSTIDIESAYEKLKQNGVEVGEMFRMPFGNMFSFKDQDGNDYILREDKQSVYISLKKQGDNNFLLNSLCFFYLFCYLILYKNIIVQVLKCSKMKLVKFVYGRILL